MISHTVYGCSTTVSYVYSTLVILSVSQPTTFRTLCAYGLRGGGGGGAATTTINTNPKSRGAIAVDLRRISRGRRSAETRKRIECHRAFGAWFGRLFGVFVEFFPLTAPL